MRDPYFGIDRLSNSRLNIFEKSPLHYQHSITNPTKPTAPMLFGSLVHYCTFEPDNVKEYCLIIDEKKRPFPDSTYQKKENKAWWDALEAQAFMEQKDIYVQEDYDKARRMRDKLYTYPQSKEILMARDTVFESGTLWNHGKTPCKGKIDIKNPYFLSDLKTGQDADPHEFHKTIFDRRYHRQGGMYLDGDAGGNLNWQALKSYMIIAIETSEPHPISVHLLSKEVIEHGYEMYCRQAEAYQICVDTGIWQGYEFKADIAKDGIFDVVLPKYLRKV